MILSLALFGAPVPGHAVSIHECRGSNGVVRFQDSPCLPGEASRKRSVAGDPVQAAPATEPAAVPDRQAVEVPADDPRNAPQQPRSPPSSTFVCQGEDGTRYTSASGVGNLRAMPLGMLGYPPMSLGEAYGGPNGIGVSAPGVSEVPVVPSRQGGGAGLYTWVQDPCTRVTGAPLCRFYADQVDDAKRRLRYAFSDTTAKVRAEIQDWQARLAECRR